MFFKKPSVNYAPMSIEGSGEGEEAAAQQPSQWRTVQERVLHLAREGSLAASREELAAHWITLQEYGTLVVSFRCVDGFVVLCFLAYGQLLCCGGLLAQVEHRGVCSDLGTSKQSYVSMRCWFCCLCLLFYGLLLCCEGVLAQVEHCGDCSDLGTSKQSYVRMRCRFCCFCFSVDGLQLYCEGFLSAGRAERGLFQL